MAKARVPTKAHLSRAAKDMHAKSAKTRKEAAEVMALAPRRSKPKGKR
jgi:hypothetical protein